MMMTTDKLRVFTASILSVAYASLSQRTSAAILIHNYIDSGWAEWDGCRLMRT